MAVDELALPPGLTLNEYRIESTLGVGGFGLTYLATDVNLNLKVAIKEYLPGDLALRGSDNTVSPKSIEAVDTFISELYLLLADEIEDREERNAFVRKAIANRE